MQDQIRVVAHFDVNAGGRAEFERLAREAAAYADENEPGTLTYDWYIAEDGKSARIYELYESPGALLTHLAGKVGTKILPAIMKVAPMTAVDVFGQSSDELVAAARGSPATLFGERLTGLTR